MDLLDSTVDDDDLIMPYARDKSFEFEEFLAKIVKIMEKIGIKDNFCIDMHFRVIYFKKTQTILKVINELDDGMRLGEIGLMLTNQKEKIVIFPHSVGLHQVCIEWNFPIFFPIHIVFNV